jgi:hypothetical protein
MSIFPLETMVATDGDVSTACEKITGLPAK